MKERWEVTPLAVYDITIPHSGRFVVMASPPFPVHYAIWNMGQWNMFYPTAPFQIQVV